MQCNKDNYCEHTTGDVSIYLYDCVLVYRVCCVYLCVSYQIRVLAKARLCVRPQKTWCLFAWNPHQGPSCTKVPRLDMCRSIITLSKIAHQMSYNHLFSQRSKTTERAVWVGVGGDMEEGFDKIWQREDRQYRVVFIK